MNGDTKSSIYYYIFNIDVPLHKPVYIIAENTLKVQINIFNT
tara:strand:+ start:1027 stop:1152 length:126 start_codon:yes stop_codon:yes gene_type:complete